jgi:hypothetical protein
MSPESPGATEPELKIILIPVNPRDRELVTIMTRPGSPRWMRIAACIALEGRRVVLIRDGHPALDRCELCGAEGLFNIRALHKNAEGADTRALQICETCGGIAEGRPLAVLESRPENPVKNFRRAF